MAPFRSLSVLCTAAVLTLAGGAAASAQDRCEGTLCDLYYEHVAPPAPAQPAQASRAQPSQTQPSQAQPAQARPQQAQPGLLGSLFGGASPPPPADGSAPPAKKPFVAVQGGGVVGLMQGRAPQRCTGTLCDLYYGGPPPEEPAATAEPAAVAPAPPARADADLDEPAAASRGFEPHESVRSCATSAHDPWACYR